MTKINNTLLTVILVSAVSYGQDEIRKLSNGFSSIPGDNRMQFSLVNYEIEDITIDGQTFKKPVVPFGGLKSEVGEPTLPTITTFYQVAPNKSYTINVNVTSSV